LCGVISGMVSTSSFSLERQSFSELFRSFFLGEENGRIFAGEKDREKEISEILCRIFAETDKSFEDSRELLPGAIPVPSFVLSNFSAEEINRDIGTFKTKLKKTLPARYMEKYGRNLSMNAILYLGGYMPPGGSRDIDFWFDSPDVQSGNDERLSTPFAVFVEKSRRAPCMKAPRKGVYGRVSRKVIVIPPKLESRMSDTNSGGLDPCEESDLWNTLVEGAKTGAGKWPGIAMDVAWRYKNSLRTRSGVAGSFSFPPIGNFTPAEFYILPFGEKGKNIFLYVFGPEGELVNPLMETNGDTLAQIFPGTENSFFDVLHAEKSRQWDISSGGKSSFDDVNILNYSEAGKVLLDSVYLVLDGGAGKKCSHCRMTRESDGSGFTVAYGTMGSGWKAQRRYLSGEWQGIYNVIKAMGYAEVDSPSYILKDGLENNEIFSLAKNIAVASWACLKSPFYRKGNASGTAERISETAVRALVLNPHPAIAGKTEYLYVYPMSFNPGDPLESMFFRNVILSQLDDYTNAVIDGESVPIQEMKRLYRMYSIIGESLSRELVWKLPEKWNEKYIRRTMDVILARLSASIAGQAMEDSSVEDIVSGDFDI